MIDRDVGQLARCKVDAVMAPVDHDLPQRPERMKQLVGAQVDRVGRKDRPLDVVAQAFVAGAQVDLERRDRTVERIRYDRDAIRRQVVEHRRERVVKHRQVILDAGRRHALTDVLIDRAATHVDVEQFVPPIAEPRNRVRRQRKFLGRQNLHRVDLLDGALGVGVESAQTRDFVVEQVDPVRAWRAHRIHVHQRSAHRELAALRHGVHASVAGLLEMAPIAVCVEPRADRQHQTVRGEERRRRQPLQQRADRHDQHAASECRQSMQRAKPVGDDVLVRRECVVSERFPVRQRHDVERAARKELQFAAQPIGRGGIGGYGQHETVVVLRRAGDGQARRSIDETAPADAIAGPLGEWRCFGICHAALAL